MPSGLRVAESDRWQARGETSDEGVIEVDPHHACLFEPNEIGPKTLKNRFYAVPHCVGFDADTALAQAMFRGMKGAGGWGAICTEYMGISPEADDTYRVNARLWDEDDVASTR